MKRASIVVLCILNVALSAIRCPPEAPYLSTQEKSSLATFFLNAPCMAKCPQGASPTEPTESEDGYCECNPGSIPNMITGECVESPNPLCQDNTEKWSSVVTECVADCSGSGFDNSNNNYCLCSSTNALSFDETCVSVSNCPENSEAIAAEDSGANYCVCKQGFIINSNKDACIKLCATGFLEGYWCNGEPATECAAECATCAYEAGNCKTCAIDYKKQDSTCVKCAAGTFSAGGTVTTCANCAKGCQTCSGKASTCQTCSANYIYNAQDNTCKACAARTFSAGGTVTSCTNCIEGCQTCKEAKTCVTCGTGWKLESNKCVKMGTSSGLSGSDVFGIVIACVVLVGGIILGIYKFVLKKPVNKGAEAGKESEMAQIDKGETEMLQANKAENEVAQDNQEKAQPNQV